MKRRGNGEGHIEKTKGGKYRAQLYIEGKRPTRTFNTQREAQTWLTSLKNDANNGTYVEPSMRRLGDYWDTWISVDKGESVSEATRSSYRFSRARLPEALFEIPISRITRQDIQKALNGLTKRGLSRRTVEITRTALQMCFEQAVTDKLIVENPAKKTILPARERQRKPKAYPLDLEMKLIAKCTEPPRMMPDGTPNQHDLKSQPYKDATLVILRTGIRRGECVNLIWSDWQDSKLLIRGTKTEKSYGYVPLTPDVIEIFKRRRKTAKSMYIFEQANGKPLRGDNLYRFVHTEFGKSVHGLRHTLARDALEAGVNPRIVQEILRHADISTTLQIYTEVTDEQKEAAIVKIAAKTLKIGEKIAAF